MAEILGIASSSIALAEVAGKIIAASLTVKRLLDDIKELPESFTLLLDQVTILTPVLVQASCDATGDSATSGAFKAALAAAVSQCRKALHELRELASELSAQMQQSRGLRRRLAEVRIALRKDVIVKHEKRLNNAVQLLMIAQQTCILSLQRMQPGLLASLVVNELEARQQLPSSSMSLTRQGSSADPVLETSPSTDARSRRPRKTQRGFLQTLMRLGVPEVTGLLEIQVPLAFRNQTGGPADGEQLVFGLRIPLPSWISSKIVDSAIYRSYSGWTQILRTYNVYHERHNNPFFPEITQTALQNDDVQLLQQQFQNRILNPFDESYLGDYDGDTHKGNLFTFAISHNAWAICNLVAEYGVGFGRNTAYTMQRRHLTNTEERVYQMMRVLKNDVALDDLNRISLLAGNVLSVASFIQLRRSIWPDNLFFTESSPCNVRPTTRFTLIERVLSNAYGPDAVAIVRSLLSREGCDDIGNPQLYLSTNDANSLLKAIARHLYDMSKIAVLMKGQTGWPDQQLVDQVRELVLDVLASAKQIYEDDCGRRLPRCLHRTLAESAPGSTNGHYIVDDKVLSLTRPTKRLHAWLEVLAEAGVDLDLYAELESPLLAFPNNINLFLEDPSAKPVIRHLSSGQYWVYIRKIHTRLTQIKYGPNVHGWKLLWTEPTDEFVRDFWRWIEPEMPLLPGSWVEDEDEDRYEEDDEMEDDMVEHARSPPPASAVWGLVDDLA